MVTPTLGSSRLAGSMQARMRGLAQDAARRVASSIGTLQEVEGALHLQLDEMAPGMRLPPGAYYITRSLALDAELHPGFGLVAGQRVLVQWVGATPLIVDVLAAPGTTEELRLTPTSPAGGALTGDYPNPELAPDSVATAHIQAGAVTGSGSGAMLLAAGGEPAIAPGAIGGADIADNAITTPKLANGAVTGPKLAVQGDQLELEAAWGTLPATITPAIDVRTPTNAPGAATLLRFRTGSAWATTMGTAQEQYWHYFGDGAGSPVWGWDGADLRRAGAAGLWHTIGAAGEPAYENGFTYYDGWAPIQFRKDIAGVVHFRGLLKCPATWGHGTACFTMPVGYRLQPEPGLTVPYHHYGCLASGGSGGNPYSMGGITIHFSGLISPWQNGGGQSSVAGTWFDLNNLRYPAF